MKYTLLKCHLASNNFDGYPAHHHFMLLAIPPEMYLSKVLTHTIYPGKEWASIIHDPRLLRYFSTVKIVGYDYKETVEPRHAGFYAFGSKGEIHDGIDTELVTGATGKLVQEVRGLYPNNNGYFSSAEVYEVEYPEPEQRYNTVAELPYGQETIQKLVDKGLLTGTGAGFDLSKDMLRILIILDRAGQF